MVTVTWTIQTVNAITVGVIAMKNKSRSVRETKWKVKLQSPIKISREEIVSGVCSKCKARCWYIPKSSNICCNCYDLKIQNSKLQTVADNFCGECYLDE